MFFYEVEGHMPKLNSFGRGKTVWPEKSLTSFLHAALQLSMFIGMIHMKVVLILEIVFLSCSRKRLYIVPFISQSMSSTVYT